MVELRDADRTLRLTLDELTHATLLHAHLKRHGQAILHAATPAGAYGWIGGHAHEIALPLVTTRPTAPNPLHGPLPAVTNTHGHLPGASEAAWSSVKLFTHPERISEIITAHLPALLTSLDTPACWWLRYRSPQETDHLRLRLRTTPGRYAECSAAVGEWTARMRQAGLVGRLVFDTYYPEVGRYGHGAALEAAENVFVADSAVAAVLRHLPAAEPDLALVVTNMVGIIDGFFGDTNEAVGWLATRPAPAATVDRAVAAHAIRLASDLSGSIHTRSSCRWASGASARGVVPLTGDESAKPGEQGARCHREDLRPPPAIHQPGQSGEPEPIRGLTADRTRQLPA